MTRTQPTNESEKMTKQVIADMNRKELTAKLAAMGEYTADADTRDIEKLRDHLLFATHNN
jgi:hypothetical protein